MWFRLLVGFNCLWQLSFVLGERKRRKGGSKGKKKEGGREREGQRKRIHGHLPIHLIQQPLMRKKQRMKKHACKIRRWGEIWKEELILDCAMRSRMSKATPCEFLEQTDHGHRWISSAPGKYCQGEGGKSWLGRIPSVNNGVSKKVSGSPTMRIKKRPVLPFKTRTRLECLLSSLPFDLY